MLKLLVRFLAMMNLGEGFIHILTSCISFYGMWDAGVWDWRIATAPTTDLFMGAISLATGYFLHNHGHTCFQRQVPKSPGLDKNFQDVS